MSEKVILSKIRSLGENIDDSILFFKQNWKPLLKAFFAICGLFWIASGIVSVFSQMQTFDAIEIGESKFGPAYFLSLLLTVLLAFLTSLVCFSYMAVYRDKGNQPAQLSEVWGYVTYYLLRFFGSAILLLIMAVIGFAFCIVPGIYIFPIVQLILAIMVMENASFGYAFNRAFKLITDKWWHVFGVLIINYLLIWVASLLITIPTMLTTLIYSFATGAHSRHVYMYAYNVSVHLSFFIHILPGISTVLIYFNLVEQKENHSLFARIEMLGKQEEETSQRSTEEEY